MKKLYRKGTVHPSPPIITDHLSFLPATILTLTAALSPEDREVLAYLISCSSNNSTPPFINNFSGSNPRKNTSKGSVVAKGGAAAAADHVGDHPPMFNCSCFRCYMSYWVRWDSSPNRQLIHEIIDAFEDWLAQSNKSGGKNRKEKRNRKLQSGELKRPELTSSVNNESEESESVGASSSKSGDGTGEGGGGGVEDEEKWSVRRLVSFIGERIWGAWSQ